VHEGCAGGDDVAVPVLLRRRDLATILFELFLEQGVLLLLYLGLLCGLEPTRPLLIHLGTGRHAIDGHVEQLPRPDDRKQLVNVVEHVEEHVVL